MPNETTVEQSPSSNFKLQWPPDLGTDNAGTRHAIQFDVLKRDGFFGASFNQTTIDQISAGTASASDIGASTFGTAIETAQESARNQTGVQVHTTCLGSVFLYMPHDIQAQYAVSYDLVSNGLLSYGGVIKMNQGGKSLDLAGTILAGAGLGARSLFGSLFSQMASLASTDSEDARRIALKGFNLAKNPHQEQLFTGVDFRNFTFPFKFNPKSEGDTKTVVSIIKTFKRAMLPSMQQNNIQRFWNYPNEFAIRFLSSDKDNSENLFKFGRCALTSVNCNYTSTGVWAAFKNGHPVEVELELNFTELEILSQEKIDEGY